MRKGIVVISLLIVFLFPLSFTSSDALASSDNWVEVTKFTGGGIPGTSPPFYIEHAEWRIKWEHTPLFPFGSQNDFSFYLSHHGGETTITSMRNPQEKNGTLEIFYYTGEFHLSFAPSNSNWTVIVEQNIDSPIQTENWAEVTTLTGQGGVSSTDPFTVEHDDWRIIWDIEPNNETTWTMIQAQIVPVNGINPLNEKIERIDESGVLRIYNHSGSFYMDVRTANIQNYTLRIEQNIHSIPEFPSWVVLPIFLVISTVVLVSKNYLRKKLD